jgi:hypothetical protein
MEKNRVNRRRTAAVDEKNECCGLTFPTSANGFCLIPTIKNYVDIFA